MLKTGAFLLTAGLAAGVLAQGRPDIINYFGGHRSGILGVAVSPDGTRMATAQNGGPINVFDVGTGQLSRVFDASARQVAFSPDGQKLISGDNAGFTVYNMTNGSALMRVGVDGFQFTLRAGAISADGTRAAGLVSNATAIIWNLNSGAIEKTFPVGGVTATSASFNSDGQTLSVGTTGGHIVSYDTGDGSLSRDITAHSGSVNTLSYHGTTIISGGADRVVKTWNSQTGTLIRQMTGHSGQVYVARMSADGRYIISGAAGAQLFLWDANTGGVLCAFSSHQGNVRAADFTPDSAEIVAGDDGMNVNHWKISGLLLVRTFSKHRGEVDEVVISPDGKTVASGAADGTVKLWRGATLLRAIPFNQGVLTLAFSPDSNYIAVGGGIVTKIYNANTGVLLGSTFHSGVSMGIAFSQDPQYLYSSCTGGELKRLTINGNQQWLIHLPGPVTYVAVPRSGSFIAAATLQYSGNQVWTNIHIVNISNGAVLRSWTAYTDYISGLTFAPNGKLITGFFDGVVRAWDPMTGGQLWSRSGPGGMNSLTLNRAGDVTVTGENENLRLFRTSDGVQLMRYGQELPNAVNSVAFSPDERWFAYGLDTGTFATAKNPFAYGVDSATLFRGVTLSGGVGSLGERDEDYWRIKPGTVFAPTEAPIQVILKGTASASSATRLTFNIVLGASSGLLQQNIELYDYQANAWQLVDSRLSSTSDQLTSYEQTSNVLRFVQPGTGEVRARISWKSSAFLGGDTWQSRMDQAYWVITP